MRNPGPTSHLCTRFASGSYPELISAPSALAQLLERETELKKLRAVVDGVRQGRGRLAVVDGFAGAGKSSLMAAASEHAAAAGLRVLSARGSELEREFAFGAIRELFEPVLSTTYEEERTRLLAGAAAPAALVIAPPDEAEGSAGRAGATFGALNGIYCLASNMAIQTPLLVAVDDLHWVDAHSLRSLSHLASRISDIPVALVVALRPAEPGTPAAMLDEVRSAPGAVTITLGALGPASVGELVRARVPDADDELCLACHSASAGNPLYLQELLRALTADGRVSAPAVRNAAVPSLADRVARRVARVASDGPALATAMAVMGDGARLAVAAELAGLEEGAAACVAHELRRIEVLAAEDPVTFVHPLVRRSVYDQLSVTERDSAHTSAARLLRKAGASAEAIASHLKAVRPAGSTSVAAALVEAAERALERAAPNAAVRWFKRALEEGAPEPPRAVILSELGFAELASRDIAAIEHLKAALELAQDPGLRARISVALAEILFNAGHWQPGREVMAAAVAELGDADPEVVVEVMAYWAVATLYDPRLVEEFDRNRERFEVLAGGESWPAHGLCAVLAAAAALRGDRIAQVVPLAERAACDGQLYAERGAGAWATEQLICALMLVDEFDGAHAVCDELAVHARRSGSFIGLVTVEGMRGWILARRGNLAAAERELRTSMDMLAPAGMPLLLISVWFFLQDAILERPSLDDVAELVKTTELDPVFLATGGGAMLLEVRGRLRLARGDREHAIADLRAFGRTATALRYGPAFSSWRSTLALALPAEQRDEAAELVAEELELARATGLARPYAIALRAAGMLAGGDEGIGQLRESTTLLERSDARLEHARSRVELGAALRRRGRRGKARQELMSGMQLAHRCGAQRLVEHALEELHAAGARPRRFASKGVDALTASELRVARLAANGRSNPEIAQELYVSLKTIETHLSHAYAKLNLAGRGARRALAQSLR